MDLSQNEGQLFKENGIEKGIIWCLHMFTGWCIKLKWHPEIWDIPHVPSLSSPKTPRFGLMTPKLKNKPFKHVGCLPIKSRLPRSKIWIPISDRSEDPNDPQVNQLPILASLQVLQRLKLILALGHQRRRVSTAGWWLVCWLKSPFVPPEDFSFRNHGNLRNIRKIILRMSWMLSNSEYGSVVNLKPCGCMENMFQLGI